MRITAAEKILNFLEKFNKRCRPLSLVPGKKNSEYFEVIASTVGSLELRDALGIPKQTISVAIDSLLNSKKILVYRFYGSDQTYIENHDYRERQREFPRPPDIRIALLANTEEEFVGEKLLSFVGGKLLAHKGSLDHISIGVSDRKVDEGSFRIHFDTGTQLLNLCIRRSIFEKTGAHPVTVFFSYTTPFNMQEYTNVISHKHIEPFGPGSICLRLPSSSLGHPSPFFFGWNKENVPELDLTTFGIYAITFYPDNVTMAVTKIHTDWPAQAVSLNSNEVTAVLDTTRWSLPDEIWPNPNEYLPLGSPPPTVDLSESHLLPNHLDAPIFYLEPWIIASNINADGELRNSKNLLPKFEGPFRDYLKSRTWKINSPAIIKFRQFSMLITS